MDKYVTLVGVEHFERAQRQLTSDLASITARWESIVYELRQLLDRYEQAVAHSA